MNWIKAIYLLIVPLVISGCFLYRHDITRTGDGTVIRDSKTLWTLGKNYTFDPNGITSTSQKVKLTTVYGIGETK